MAAFSGIGLVMNMSCRHMGVQDDLISAGKTEVEYSGLQMVDPDDRVEMLWHHVVPVTGELNWCFLREGAALVC
jgi:hypothetical protein